MNSLQKLAFLQTRHSVFVLQENRTSFAGQAQLAGHIDVSLVINSSLFRKVLHVQVAGIGFPWGATKLMLAGSHSNGDIRDSSPIDTADSLSALGSCPLIETDLVYVIPACGATPDNFFVGRFKFHEANRAIAFDGFPLAVVTLGFGLLATER